MAQRLASHMRAHFVAYLALFFALGGTSFAAVEALPKNSVGSPQIKNRSIQKVDISRRTISSLRGLRGPRGLQGVKGDKGDKGDTGAPGAPNPNAVDSDKVDGYHANELARVARMQTSATLSTDDGEKAVASVTITAPRAGFVAVTSTNDAEGGTCGCLLETYVGGDAGTSGASYYTDSVLADSGLIGYVGTTVNTEVFTVTTAGAHTFTVYGDLYGAAAQSVDLYIDLNARFVPFGSTGGSTLGSARRSSVPQGPGN